MSHNRPIVRQPARKRGRGWEGGSTSPPSTPALTQPEEGGSEGGGRLGDAFSGFRLFPLRSLDSSPKKKNEVWGRN